MMVDVQCQQCGTTWKTYASFNRKFCSRDCRAASRRKATVAGRYRMVYAPGHPLSGNSPVVAQHRLVLWGKIGPGPHPCHYCGTSLDWPYGAGPVEGTIIADHVDRDTSNNTPDNLVPTCTRCSLRNRRVTIADGDRIHRRSNGHTTRTEIRQCQWCAESFTVVPAQVTRPGKGRFCSKSCASAARRALQREGQDGQFVTRAGGSRVWVIPRVCAYCGAHFLAIASQVKRGGGRFCSRSCGAKNSAASKAGAANA